MAARQAGSGTDWLFPFVDGHPPIGWEDASAYLVLPVLLVLAQVRPHTFPTPPAHRSSNHQRHVLDARLARVAVPVILSPRRVPPVRST